MAAEKTKRCTKCKRIKKITEFHRNKKATDGYQVLCEDCSREYQREHYIRNRDKIKERNRLRYTENREKISERQRQYRIENREKISERHRQYRIENREKVKERQRLWYIENREKNRERQRLRYIENREKISDVYIKKQLRAQGLLSGEGIKNPSLALIDLKQKLITIHRIKRRMQNELNRQNDLQS